MHEPQRQQTHELLKQKGIDVALFSSPHSVTWLTGFAERLDINPFAVAPHLVLYDNGTFGLLVMDAFKTRAEQSGCEVMTYPGYSYLEPSQAKLQLEQVLRSLLPKNATAKIGIEGSSLPHAIQEILLGYDTTESIDGWLHSLQMVKTQEELSKLRQSFELSDLAQATARAAVKEGQREIDVWNALQTTVQARVAAPLTLGHDCVVSYRQNNSGGHPSDYELRQGDSLLVDVGVCYQGYWSDSCATYYVSEATSEQRKTHQAVQEALELAISFCKPGTLACDIDKQVREHIRRAGFPDYPHHTGHGVGVSSHEEPRIVPYNQTLLEAGMVVMLEPAIYVPCKYAVRLEDAVLITNDGAELLTHHWKGL
jgi:Xaa-Pro dipeptidase